MISLLAILAALLPNISAAAVITPLDSSQAISIDPANFYDAPIAAAPLGAIDPKKFSARVQYTSQALPGTAVLMSLIDVMTQFALQDWEDNIGPKSYRMDDPRYSQVEIYIGPWNPDPHATLKAGYGVLGLFEMMANILTDPKNRFKSVHGHFMYDDQEVGVFAMRKVTAGDNSPLPNESTSLRTSTSTAPAWLDPHLTLELIQNRDVLTIYEIFFASAAALRELAPFSTSQKVRDVSFDINAPPITTAGTPMLVLFRNIGRTPRQPPFFKYEWAIKAVAQLPSTLLFEKRDLHGVSEMVIIVDSIHVGLGVFSRKPA
ncbi:MAG: hypothetical protein Q9170_004783 [Blastenia crenularia]